MGAPVLANAPVTARVSRGRRDIHEPAQHDAVAAVFSNDDTLISFGSVTNNRIFAGSVMQIALETDSNANVEKMTFSATDPAATSPPIISMFRPTGCFRSLGLVNVVGAPQAGGRATFTSGSGVLTYTVSSGPSRPNRAAPDHVRSSCRSYR